ncbi:Arm DNA-binding domain-containing protein [Rugamonas brunnea]|uniref:Arm DNA-binding domain-containing protein n=1 Tax=Rugamonas brunnea TaxID=2758569 RepID=UPI001E3DD01D|nr:Arm DNA-binding domain-containing protein [Rugamonas brunnea]
MKSSEISGAFNKKMGIKRVWLFCEVWKKWVQFPDQYDLTEPMLADAHRRNAKPQENLYRLRDSRGLYLEVKTNGIKAWRYLFKIQG